MAPHTLPSRPDVPVHSYRPYANKAANHVQEGRHYRKSQNRNIAERPGTIPSVRILVLGVGNVLMTDEAVGARVIEALRKEFEFSENVELMVDWTMCYGLLHSVIGADALIVLGAMRAGRLPGVLHRFVYGELPRSLMQGGSLHEVALAETLAAAEILGRKPETVILGIEPEDTASRSTRLTETVELRVPEILDAALREIRRLGGTYKPKDPRTHPRVAPAAAVV